jgi:spermidine/putrescine transport system permease protein
MATQATPSVQVTRERRGRSSALSSTVLLGPSVAILLAFLLAPLYYVFLYSVGLRYLAKTPALALLTGEQTSFTTEFWTEFLGKGVTVRLAGGAEFTTPSWVAGLVIALLLAGTLLGTRLPHHGRLVAGLCAISLIIPFTTIPWGEGLLRLVEVRSDATFLRLFFKSVGMAMTSSLFAVFFAFPVAYYMAFVLKKSKYTWILIVITPFLTSYLLRVFAWTIVLGDEGLVNTALKNIGLIDKPLTWLLYTPFTVMVVLTYAWVPFICLPIFIALENIDRRLLEAATDLGASRITAFFRITVPLAAPGLVAAFLFVFIPSIGEYVTPSLVGGTKGYMFGNAIVSQFIGGALDWQTGSVLALFLVVVVLMLTAATARFLRAGGGTT